MSLPVLTGLKVLTLVLEDKWTIRGIREVEIETLRRFEAGRKMYPDLNVPDIHAVFSKQPRLTGAQEGSTQSSECLRIDEIMRIHLQLSSVVCRITNRRIRHGISS